jgi:hypothetical protein
MTELGKIDKLDVASLKNKKMIYFVRNLYLPQNATEGYKSIFNRYWDQVEEHLSKLETAGKISKIFCESIYMSGEDSMKVLKAMNERLEQLVKKKIKTGGEFLPLESKEIFGAYIDWNNCLMLVRTSSVYERIDKFLKEAITERFKHIKSVLKENIKENEAGLLIMRDKDIESLDLPDDIKIFFVTPPSYDDLLQFIRDRDSGKEYWRA